MNLDDVFLEKEEIAKDIKDELTKSMSSYGYLIVRKCTLTYYTVTASCPCITCYVLLRLAGLWLLSGLKGAWCLTVCVCVYTDALVNDIEPASKVKDAMNEINAVSVTCV